MNLVGLPRLSAEPLPNEAQRVRSLIRQATITSTSRGQAMGFLQCNLAILPKTHADEFWLYYQHNAKACQVLEVTQPGHTEPQRLAPGADLRTDCARYAVFLNGQRQADQTDIVDLWRDDLVTFLIGLGITFDEAFEQAGMPTHSERWVVTTTLPTEPAGVFRGPMIATMRWLSPEPSRTVNHLTVSPRPPR